jgi:hypothetical protein
MAKAKFIPKFDLLNKPLAGWRGFYAPNSGGSQSVVVLDEFHGTTAQVCGLYPFSAGSALTSVGVPLGHNIFTGATVCCDPINWFARKGVELINNPSMFVFGNPGLGKSTSIRRLLIGLEAQGIMPLVLGDLRPDYVDIVKCLNGQVITLQEGKGHLNILDPGDATSGKIIINQAIENTPKTDTQKITKLQDALIEIDQNTIGYQFNTLRSFVALYRGSDLNEFENNVVNEALKELQNRFKNEPTPPILQDLYDIIINPTEKMMLSAVENTIKGFKKSVKSLQAVILGLIEGGAFGTIFSKQTDQPMKIDKPVVFDISKVSSSGTNKTLRAAILMACWTTGFGTVQIAKLLASLGLEKQRHYFIVMDEMHQALGAGIGMVERIDYLTRLNRAEGVGQAMITHTPKDLLSLPTEEERQKAKGLVERSGLKFLGGLSKQDLELLDEIIDLSQTEKDLVNNWQNPAGFAAGATPPGRGKFLIKIGGKPGIPVSITLTSAELEAGINATSSLWEHLSKTGGNE